MKKKVKEISRYRKMKMKKKVKGMYSEENSIYLRIE